MLGAHEKRAVRRVFAWCLAETEGFEPSMRLYTPYSLSRGAPSATRSRFQCCYYAIKKRLFNLSLI